MPPHLETCAENPAGLSGSQEANLQAVVVELRLAFSVSLLMNDSSIVIVPQPDTQGKFRHWPSSKKEGHLISLLSSEVQVLLWNGNIPGSHVGETWKKIA